MNLAEAGGLLLLRREQVRTLITKGVRLPVSGNVAALQATQVGADYDITEQSLQEFIARRDEEEPGEHPPVAVRRQLLFETGSRCAVCGDGVSLHFHHMIEYARVQHYDPANMLLVCMNCHGRCTRGEIDYSLQQMHKATPWVNRQGGSQDWPGTRHCLG